MSASSALFRQAGVVQVDTLAELFDVGALLASQPLPAGRRVGIVTNSGRASDPLRGHLPGGRPRGGGALQRTREALASRLSTERRDRQSRGHVGGGGAAMTTSGPSPTLAESGEVDAIIAIFTPALETAAEVVEKRWRAAPPRSSGRLPMLMALLPGTAPRRAGPGPPRYAFGEDAARALAAAAHYAEWRRAPRGLGPHFDDLHREEAAAGRQGSARCRPRWLAPERSPSSSPVTGSRWWRARAPRTAARSRGRRRRGWAGTLG